MIRISVGHLAISWAVWALAGIAYQALHEKNWGVAFDAAYWTAFACIALTLFYREPRKTP